MPLFDPYTVHSTATLIGDQIHNTAAQYMYCMIEHVEVLVIFFFFNESGRTTANFSATLLPLSQGTGPVEVASKD